jgi:hypothetical protein
MNSILESCTDDGAGNCIITLYSYSLNPGILLFDNLNITFFGSTNPIYLDTEVISQYVSIQSTTDYVYVPVTMTSVSDGIIGISDIKQNYVGGNQTYDVTIHDITGDNTLTYQLTMFYSSWNYSYPRGITAIDFYPSSRTSKNVSAFGQSTTKPILNITSYAYGQPGLDFYMWLNNSPTCLVLTSGSQGILSRRNSSNSFVVDASWSLVNSNLTYLNGNGMWLWTDYECSSLTNLINYYYPDLYFRACATGVDVCSEDLT